MHGRIAIGLTSVTGVVFVMGAVVLKTSNERFDQIFNNQRGQQTEIGSTRIQFKKVFTNTISTTNPCGIIFVCGRPGSGKTTAIMSALADRKHVAYINWRGTPISTPNDLNQSLQRAFHVESFKEYIKAIGMDKWVFKLLQVVPDLEYGSERSSLGSLEQTMHEIEKIIKFANKSPSNVKNRPVIVVDDGGTVEHLLAGRGQATHLLLNWLVRLSKDEMFCDVVLVSSNGFLLELLNLGSMQYHRSIVFPDLTEDELRDLIKENNHAATNQMFIKMIISAIGNNAKHILKINDKEYAQHVANIMRLEHVRFEHMTAGASKSCSSWWRKVEEGCYELGQLMAVLKLFIVHPSADPEIPLLTVLREASVGRDVIRKMVSSECLFLDPETWTLKVRNRIYLHLARQKWGQAIFDAEMERHERLAQDINIGEQQRVASRKRADEVMEILRSLRDLP